MRTGTILDAIVEHKREEVAERKKVRPLATVENEASLAAPPRDFAARLRVPGIALIAEVKRASPSRGALRMDLDPIAQATAYAQNGAAAISVLTDTHYFHGSLEDLRVVHGAVTVPVLCKDFILEPYQVVEARATGADAVLLIVAALEDTELVSLQNAAHSLGMAALVEVHTLAELERAMAAQPQIIGTNNRNLHTFDVSLETTAVLRPQVPAGVTVVAESGIQAPADVARLAAIGVDAMLVGTALVTASNPGQAVRNLIAAGSPLAPHHGQPGERPR